MNRCNSEFRDLGGWISCDATTCTTRSYSYLGEGEYAWTTIHVEPCAGPPLPADVAVPPIHGSAQAAAAIALWIVIAAAATYLAARDKRIETRRSTLAADCAVAKLQRSAELPTSARDRLESARNAVAKRKRFQLDPRILEIIAKSARDQRIPLILDPTLVADLSTAPHLLVAGTSGSGKSVAINAMIQGIIASDSADLWLADPKRVEAAPYRGVVARVADTPATIADLLRDATVEMDRRYQDLLDRGLRAWPDRPIVIVIDEYADLTIGKSAAAKQAEQSIIRLAQLGRAAAIHVILATQRPSADVINPLIRANLPARLALRCSTAGESRVIRGDSLAYDGLPRGPGYAIWSQGDKVVRAPHVDPYAN